MRLKKKALLVVFFFGFGAAWAFQTPAPRTPRRLSATKEWFEARPVASLVKEWHAGDGPAPFATTEEEVPPQGEAEMAKIEELISFLHAQLMLLSPEFDAKDEDEEMTDDDLVEFIDEGRKMLAISRSRVCYGEDADAVAHDVWTSVAALLQEGVPDSGLLVALPTFVGCSERYLESEIVAPLVAMGIQPDLFEARSYKVAHGAPFPAFRLLYAPSEAPLHQEEKAVGEEDGDNNEPVSPSSASSPTGGTKGFGTNPSQ
mmetsp:Transcript_10578/g.34954  ORF Transcript_10578/g.34954 Transcript_10578/m.34954 type:complete len:259 (+) Transcript_10578:2726-3502(+)